MFLSVVLKKNLKLKKYGSINIDDKIYFKNVIYMFN